jgi:hypothetical protein
LEKCPESRFEDPAIDAGEPRDAHENEGGNWSCKARRCRRRPEARGNDGRQPGLRWAAKNVLDECTGRMLGCGDSAADRD